MVNIWIGAHGMPQREWDISEVFDREIWLSLPNLMTKLGLISMNYDWY